MKSVSSLGEVRRNIDRIDRRLVPLLAERGRFVREAARFKRTAREVPAPARAARVVRNVRRLARRHGLDPAIAERVWRAMIAAFIRFEHGELRKLRRRRPGPAREGSSR